MTRAPEPSDGTTIALVADVHFERCARGGRIDHRGRRVAASCVVFFALGLARPVNAGPTIEPGTRFVTVFDETIDGRAANRSTIEAELSRALIARSFELVDAEQSRAIRARLAGPGRDIASMPKDIASFDADVILQGTVELRRVESQVLPKNVSRYDARIDVRLIRVDSAALVGSLSVQRASLGVTRQVAVGNAARKAAEALAEEIAALVEPDRESTVELFVVGLSDVGSGKNVRDAIGRLPRIRELVVHTEGSEQARYRIRSSYESAQSLAEALHESVPALSVVGFSKTVVKAQFRAAPTVRLPLGGATFEYVGRDSTRWMNRTLPALLATELARHPEFDISQGATHRLVGRIEARENQLTIAARLVLGQPKRTIAKVERRCATNEPDDCVRDLALALHAAFESHAPTDTRRDTARDTTRPLVMDRLVAEPVFPAALAASPESPVGKVRLKNTGKKAIRNVIVRARIPALSRRSITSAIEKIDASQSIELDIRVDVERSLIRALSEHRSSVLALQIEYVADGLTVRESRDYSVLVYALRTIDWRASDALAPFVQPRAPVVQQLVAAARDARTSALETSKPLARAVTLHEVLRRLNLRYEIDATRPFSNAELDDVRFPHDTLEGRAGDCDDLSVLAASVGEAMGFRVVLLATPKHVLYAVGTGLPPQATHHVPAARARLIEHDDELFIPLEATTTDATFESAWTAGLRAWRKWEQQHGRRQLIDVRAEWRKKAPLHFEDRTTIVLPDLTTLERDVRAVVETLANKQRAKLDAASPLVRARLLARLGSLKKAQTAVEDLKRLEPNSPYVGLLAGNLELLRGNARAALVRFRSSIPGRTREVRGLLHINAAVAALYVGDREVFDEHVLSALECGRTSEVRTLTHAGAQLSSRQGKGEGQGATLPLDRYLVWGDDVGSER